MSLKTELQSAIDYCNTALVNKGADEASTVYEIGDMIDTIQQGGSVPAETILVNPYAVSISGMLASAYQQTANKEFTLDMNGNTALTNISSLFYTTNIKSVTIKGSTANVKNFREAFRNNYYNFATIDGDGLDFSSATDVTNIFMQDASLVNVKIVANTLSISIGWANSASLSLDSLASIIAGLKDMTGQTAPTLTLHATAKAKLTTAQTAEITAKNWTLA